MSNNPSLPTNHDERVARAAVALDGLSVGDAVGENCFRPANWNAIQADPPAVPEGPWPWTDDTAMALGIYEVLDEHGTIDQDALARRFAARYRAQPWRGYGPGAHRLLDSVANGLDWRAVAECVFPGGSFGNGSAMRIAPLSGYFAEDDYARIAREARLSAGPTHAHPEGLAGAVATAVAGAYAWKHRAARADAATKRGLFDVVLEHTPRSDVRRGVEVAATMGFELSVETVSAQVGNGRRISCQDTVPFCVWIAANHLDDYQTAIVRTIRVGGDIDTNCAIVGGIVALAVGRAGVPGAWLTGREDLVV
jgi:ADP-ribosylglycohydrolase